MTFVATYHSSNPANSDIQVPITDALVLPSKTMDYVLTEIDAQFPKGGLRSGDRSLISRFVFSATRNGQAIPAVTLSTSDASDGSSTALFRLAETNTREPIENIDLRVQASYSADFLCQVETSYRTAKGKDFTSTSYDDATRNVLEVLKNKIALQTLGKDAPMQVRIAADDKNAFWTYGLPESCKDSDCLRRELGEVLLTVLIGQRGKKKPESAQEVKQFKDWVTGFLAKPPKSGERSIREVLLDELIAAESTSKGYRWFRIIETTGNNPVPILYSFCSPQHNAVDWAKASVAKIAGVGAIADSQHTHDAHKLALFELLKDKLPTFGLGTDPRVEVLPGPPLTVVTEPGLSNVVVTYSTYMTMIKDASRILRLVEQTATGEHDIQTEQIIDQVSSVYLRVDTGYVERESRTCALLGYCDRVFDMPGFQIQFAVKDQSNNVTQPSAAAAAAVSSTSANNVTSPVVSLVPVEDGLRAVGNVSWSTFLGSTLTPTLYVTLNGKQVVLGNKPPFTIKNLGLITTFPGVSEIQGLINDDQASNQKSSSTIPISWAWNMRTGNVSSVAITLPWMLSYNSRSAPDLSKYFAVFAHVSLILNASSDPTMQSTQSVISPSLGAGISLMQFFQFSWAMDKQGDNFLLVGASIPDLAKLNW
jgi:hypothetical protein